MKKIVLITTIILLVPFVANAATLSSALKTTFENNLELQAERKNLEVQKEVLNISGSKIISVLVILFAKESMLFKFFCLSL